MLGWVQDVPLQTDTLVLKIQTKVFQDERQVKIELF